MTVCSDTGAIADELYESVSYVVPPGLERESDGLASVDTVVDSTQQSSPFPTYWSPVAAVPW